MIKLAIWPDPTHWPIPQSIRSRFIWYLVIWPDPTHWPTDPPNHPHTHPWVGVSLQIINLQTELNYLDSVNIFKIFSVLTWSHHQPTHPPIHPPNHTSINGWRILHKFQIFKQNWNILISSSVIEFLLIPGVPLGGWWMGGWWWGWVWVCGRVSHAHMHAHTCTYIHMHAWTHTHTCYTW